MKLFLTSSGLSDTNEKDFLALLGREPKGFRVAFIPTAMNKEPEEVKQKYIPVDVADLENLGMKVDFIDLEKLNEEKILSTFKPYDVIYVYGGNTFYLMKYANQSGFRKHIFEIIKDKIYFGVSAGSVIAGEDIAIAGWENGDPNSIGLSDMKGLSLFPFSVLPHWNGEIPKEAQEYRHKIRYIKDGEAVVIKHDDSLVEELKSILSQNADKRITIIGTTCTGKSTLLKEIPEGVEMKDISPALTDEERAFTNQSPWTPEIGEKMFEIRGEKAKLEIGKPVFGTVIAKNTDLIIYLKIDDEVLRKRVNFRNGNFDDAKAMQEWIEQKITDSKLPTVILNIRE